MVFKILEEKNIVFIFSLVVKIGLKWLNTGIYSAQKMKFFIKYIFSECDQIYGKLQVWSRLLKKSSMENFIFCVVITVG